MAPTPSQTFLAWARTWIRWRTLAKIPWCEHAVGPHRTLNMLVARRLGWILVFLGSVAPIVAFFVKEPGGDKEVGDVEERDWECHLSHSFQKKGHVIGDHQGGRKVSPSPLLLPLVMYNRDIPYGHRHVSLPYHGVKHLNTPQMIRRPSDPVHSGQLHRTQWPQWRPLSASTHRKYGDLWCEVEKTLP